MSSVETQLPPMSPGLGDLGQPVCLLAEGLAGLERPVDAPAVLVRRGRIQALGQEALAAGARRLALPGLWLSPAPLDAHVHLYLGGTVEDNLERTLEAGVAAVRDLGQRPVDATPRTRPGHRPPWVVPSGTGLGWQGEGHCWLAQQLEGPEAYRQAAWQRAQEGVSLIKVFVTGLLDFDHPGQVLQPLAVSAPELAAAVAVAQEAGLPLAVHASGAEAVTRCLEAGVSSVEHGFFLGRGQLEDMAARRISWVPTAVCLEIHAQDPEGRHSPQVRENLWAITRGQMEALVLAESLGVDMVLGTDAGSYALEHGQAVFREMDCWLRAGVRPRTVYQAATRRAARLMGLAGVLGSLETGALAWLLAVPGNPEKDPMLLARPRWRSF